MLEFWSSNLLKRKISSEKSFLCFVAAVPQREAGHQLQSEAEGEVPASPANQAHFSSPTSTQERFPREERAEGHEGGSPAKVRTQLFPFTPWKTKKEISSW